MSPLLGRPEASIVAVMVVGGTNLITETITGSGSHGGYDGDGCGNSVSQIATFWNPLAGVDAGN